MRSKLLDELRNSEKNWEFYRLNHKLKLKKVQTPVPLRFSMMIHKSFREGQTCRGTPLFQICQVPLSITFGTIRIYTYFTLTTYPTEHALP